VALATIRATIPATIPATTLLSIVVHRPAIAR
jgi:hypothetical protein